MRRIDADSISVCGTRWGECAENPNAATSHRCLLPAGHRSECRCQYCGDLIADAPETPAETTQD